MNEKAVKTFASPLGTLTLVASEVGLCEIRYGTSKPREGSSTAQAHLKTATSQLAEYFTKKRKDFDVPLDLAWASPFQRKVLTRLKRTRSGQTFSYQQLAGLVGAPNAARAVGSAMARNCLPIVIPCHRVLPASGKLGKYTSGPSKKQQLLALEGAKPTL